MLGQNPYAEEALKLASIARNQGGMTRTSAPIGSERQLSSGLTDKVEFNEQPERNNGYTQESIKANTMSAVPQAQANAIRGMRKQQVDISQQEYEAQELLNRRKAEVLYANDGGAAVMKMGELAADPPQMQELMRRVGESQMMAKGNNPHNKFQSTSFYG